MRLTRQQVKYGVAFFVSGCLLAVAFNSCSGNCIAAMGQDKLSALIYQVQGKCCFYTTKSTSDPKTYCQEKFNPFVPRFKYKCVSDAALCLGGMGKDASKAVPALIKALETGPNNYNTGDGTIPTRNDIMYALGATGDPRAVKPLIAALYSPRLEDTHRHGFQRPQPLGQDAAMYALGSLGPTAKEAVPHIIPFLNNSRSNLFEAAAKALTQIKDPRAIPALIEALNHPTYSEFAADALGELGALADEAAPIMIEMLKKSPRRPDRWDLVDAITKIRGKDAVPRIPMIIYREKSSIFF